MPRLPQATHPQAKLLTEHCDVGIGAKPGLLAPWRQRRPHRLAAGDRSAKWGAAGFCQAVRVGCYLVVVAQPPKLGDFYMKLFFQPPICRAGYAAFSLMMDLTYDISSKSWLKPPATTRWNDSNSCKGREVASAVNHICFNRAWGQVSDFGEGARARSSLVRNAGQTLGPTFGGALPPSSFPNVSRLIVSFFGFFSAWHQSHSEGFRIKRNMSLRNQDGPGDLGWLAGIQLLSIIYKFLIWNLWQYPCDRPARTPLNPRAFMSWQLACATPSVHDGFPLRFLFYVAFAESLASSAQVLKFMF